MYNKQFLEFLFFSCRQKERMAHRPLLETKLGRPNFNVGQLESVRAYSRSNVRPYTEVREGEDGRRHLVYIQGHRRFHAEGDHNEVKNYNARIRYRERNRALGRYSMVLPHEIRHGINAARRRALAPANIHHNWGDPFDEAAVPPQFHDDPGVHEHYHAHHGNENPEDNDDGDEEGDDGHNDNNDHGYGHWIHHAHQPQQHVQHQQPQQHHAQQHDQPQLGNEHGGEQEFEIADPDDHDINQQHFHDDGDDFGVHWDGLMDDDELENPENNAQPPQQHDNQANQPHVPHAPHGHEQNEDDEDNFDVLGAHINAGILQGLAQDPHFVEQIQHVGGQALLDEIGEVDYV